MDLELIEKSCREKIRESSFNHADPAHDELHFRRVVAMARILSQKEQARWEIVMPAAWLHDLVVIPKNDPRRSLASRLSADEARIFLKSLDYPENWLDEVCHAIEAHSFSAAIEPRTIEAKVVQDADRLDGLGAVGIARCFATAGLLGRSFYSEDDPFCEKRAADDSRFTVDHFYRKLLQVATTLQTATGKVEGQRRLEVMQNYLADFKREML